VVLQSSLRRAWPVDVRIGVTNTPREIEVELAEGTDGEALAQQIEHAISESTVLWLTDRKGRRIGVPAAKLAYVELDAGSPERRVGFGAAVPATATNH
jgi:hypothetical protein